VLVRVARSRFENRRNDGTKREFWCTPILRGNPYRTLPGLAELDGKYNNNPFADQRLDQNGLPLVRSPTASPRWRIRATPSDRNLLDFNVDAGVVMKGPLKGRDDDSVGLAVGNAQVSSSSSAFDRDMASTTPGYPLRSAETVVEATYQYQVTPWWVLQADFQYFFRPGGGTRNPSTGARIGNEAVAGLRTVFTF
jgi:porin